MTETPTPSGLNAALRYLALGWPPVPIAPRSKTPLVAWRALQAQPPAPDALRRWYRRWPEAGVAVVTGAVSGLVVLDVDPAHGGAQSLARLQARHRVLPPTPEVFTGGGGRHLYFAHPGGALRNRVGIAPGLDLRADGGLVIAPPSIHPSGNAYAWRTGRGPDDIALAPLPDWLCLPQPGEDDARLAEPSSHPFGPARDPERGQSPGHPAGHWRQLLHDGVAEGRRNAAVASITGHLLWRGVDPEVVAELMLGWNRLRCRPPLADDEVLRTVRSIQRTQQRHRWALGLAGSAPPPAPPPASGRATGAAPAAMPSP